MANVKKKCIATEYHLTLNTEEAQVLLAVLQMIGGDLTRYPRRVTENISDALKDADIEAAVLQTQCGKDCIYFASNS